jgi:hypothetical protein
MSKNQITEILKKTFPHWTDKQISDFEKFLTSSFTNVTNKDFDVILTNLNDSILTVIRKYDIQSTQPGRLRTIYKRMLFNIYDQNKRKSPLKELGEYFEERYDGLDEINSIEKIQNFFRVIRKSNALTKAFDPLCEHLEIVSLKLIEELNENSETWKRKDFWDEVELSLKKSGIVYSDENFRQLQSRLKNRLIERLPDAEGLLHLHKDNKEEEKALQQLLFALSFTSINYLKAYRFSEEELEKMIWLKNLFEENGYTFEPNRFPEVYYDDFEMAKEIFPWIETGGHEGTLDFLGMYIYNLEEGFLGKPCDKSKEGVIVLFKDRIENYCAASGTDINSVRFVVLMHELGHWLSHWPKRDNYNWSIGFHLPNTQTKEALAQLVAHWSCNDNSIHYQTLLKLTPKVVIDPDKLVYMKAAKEAILDDGSVINTEDPYGRYWLIKDKAIKIILNKLHELREGWLLKDEKMIEFLISNSENLENWIKSQGEIEESDLIIKFDNKDCIGNISPKILQFQGLERLSKSYKLLQSIGAKSTWHEDKF